VTRLSSIRSRLTRLLVGVAVVGGCAVSVLVWLVVRHEVDELRDETLRASAQVLLRLLGGDELRLADIAPPQPGDAGQGTEPFAWQLVGPGAQVLQRSARAPTRAWMPLPTVGLADAPSGWRVFGVRLGSGERVLYVAQSRDERHEAASEVAISAIWAALAVGLASAWWLRSRVRRELQPLADLSDALGRFEPLQRDARLPAATRRELVPIHDAIEALGQRLAQRVANERAFSAHAAHALRTPLAGIDAQLAVAMRECPPELGARLARVREASARLTRVVTALLALFRSGVELQWQRVELAALLARLPHEGLALKLPSADALVADPDLLTAALLNLLDNAMRHGATQVDLTLSHRDGRQTLRLQDNGHGVAPAQRQQLAGALQAQAYEGRMGLGLMLADLVARAHGGALTLPECDQGFAVQIELGPPPGEAASPGAP